MAEDVHAKLLERATAALERIDRTFERQSGAFDRQAEAFDRHAEAFDRHAEAFVRQAAAFDRLTRRIERSENLFIQAISDIDASIQRSVERLDDMGDSIRANTQAVLSMLDRLGPAPG
jgi:hypothetical protein